MPEPQAPTTTSPPGHYDFILNPPKPKRRNLIPTGNTPKQRLLLIVIYAGVGLVMLILVLSIFSGSNDAKDLTDLAQTQAEIIRVSTIGTQKARGPDAKNLAITTQLSLESSQNDTQNQLNKLGNKLSPKQLLLKKNTLTDQQLTTADESGSFDSVFAQIIQGQLANYQAAVQKLYKKTTSKAEKQFLAADYSSAGLLIGEKISTN